MNHEYVVNILIDIVDEFMWCKPWDSSERDESEDPHLCSGSATPQNPPDGGNPSTMYLEKIQKNSGFENSEFESASFMLTIDSASFIVPQNPSASEP